MKAIVLYHSVHHHNTEKIAQAIAETLSAECKSLVGISGDSLVGYDLIGFGSGIYALRHHPRLLEFAGKLPASNKKVFIFSTSGLGSTGFHKALKKILADKGYIVIDEFACKGFDTFGFLKLFGGVNKGRPDTRDIEKAVQFARTLL